jgi:hypothetical protein
MSQQPDIPHNNMQSLLLSEYNKKEKVKIALPDYPSIILPSVNVVLELFFGKSISIRQTVRFMESVSKIDSQISDSSLDNFSKRGVGKKTLSKFGLFFDKVALPERIKSLVDHMNKPPFEIDKVPPGSNYSGWLSFLWGIKQHDPVERKPLLDFLESRAQQEKSLFEEAGRLREAGKTTVECFAFLRDSYNDIGYLETETLDIFFDLFNRNLERNDISVDAKSMVAFVKLKLDFYFCLLASYEVGLIAYVEKTDPQLRSNRPDIFEHGFFSYWLPILGEESGEGKKKGELVFPFELFLDYLRNSKDKEPISWRVLAKSIPVNVEQESADTKHEAQIDRLKAWRKGDYYPGSEVLETFLVNLSGDSNVVTMQNLAICAVALDKLVRVDMKQVDKELGSAGASAIVEEGYSCYPLYWSKYKEMYLKDT